MAKLAAAESENTNGEPVPEAPTLKAPTNTRSAASAAQAKSGAGPTGGKKGLVIDSVDFQLVLFHMF